MGIAPHGNDSPAQGRPAQREEGGGGRQGEEDHLLAAKDTRTALGKQAAAVAKRKARGGSRPSTRAELYEEAKRKQIPGRSKMGRAELARAVGHD